jgi:hypothetical protein
MSAKRAAYIFALIALVLAVYAFPLINSGGEVTELEGTVIAPFDRPDFAARNYYMRVALASGEEVLLPIPRTTPVVPGRLVVLGMRRSPLGTTTYGFRRYAGSEGE